MGYKLKDFECSACGNKFEELISPDEVPPCPECGAAECEALISIPNLATMNLLSKEEYVAKMKKRSADHTKRTIMKEGVNGRAAVNLTRKSGNV